MLAMSLFAVAAASMRRGPRADRSVAASTFDMVQPDKRRPGAHRGRAGDVIALYRLATLRRSVLRSRTLLRSVAKRGYGLLSPSSGFLPGFVLISTRTLPFSLISTKCLT